MKRTILYLLILIALGMVTALPAEGERLKDAARFVGDAVDGIDASQRAALKKPYTPLQRDLQRIQKDLRYLSERFENFPEKESLPSLNARLDKMNTEISSLQSRLDKELNDIQNVINKRIVPKYQIAVLEEAVNNDDYAFASVWFGGMWDKIQGGKDIEKMGEDEARHGERDRDRRGKKPPPQQMPLELGHQWLAKIQEAAEKQKQNEPVDFPKDEFLGFLDDLEKALVKN